MGCGCGKKREGSVQFIGKEGFTSANPDEWGPILWKYLHCLAEKIGTTGNPIIDTDQATYLEYLINNLSSIIPCIECQKHINTYTLHTPLPTLKGLYGETLRTTARNWLLQFHNAVRIRKQQPIMISNLDQLTTQYSACTVQQCEITLFTQSVAYAVRQGWVKIDQWRKWYNFSERLKMLVGNIIIK